MGLGSSFATLLHKRHFADEDLSIPELSPRNKRNRRKLYCNLQKAWDSSDSLNGNSSSLFIFIRSTIPKISGDFLTRWNAIIVRKGRDKGQFLGNSYFWIKVLGLNYLTKEPPSFPTVQVKARLYKFYCRTEIQLSRFFFFVVVVVLCTKSLL